MHPPTPVFTALVVTGIILLGVLPPIGLGLIILAFAIQKRRQSIHNDNRHYRTAEARERLRREKVLASKLFR